MQKLRTLHDTLGGLEDYKKVFIKIEVNSSGSELKIDTLLKREPDSIFSALNTLDDTVKSLGPYPKGIHAISLEVQYQFDIGIYESYYNASKSYPNIPR